MIETHSEQIARIAVEVRGRLGNQMFQFAFGLAASRQLGTDFVIADDVLTLENVRGNSSGGELKLRSLMDFRGAASIMKFSIEAGLWKLT